MKFGTVFYSLNELINIEMYQNLKSVYLENCINLIDQSKI